MQHSNRDIRTSFFVTSISKKNIFSVVLGFLCSIIPKNSKVLIDIPFLRIFISQYSKVIVEILSLYNVFP